MEITALCTIIASLRVVPNRSHFFVNEPVTLSCDEPGNSSDWRVKRNTSRHTNEECSITWGRRNGSQCFIDDVYALDNGVYWCESGAGECSNVVNITVTGGSVILEGPVLPVQEGQAVTLRCINKTTSSSNMTVGFYKDGFFIGSSSTGNMTINSVSKSDEGLYKCGISGAGESPDSRLVVTAGRPESFQSPLVRILLPVVGVCLLLVSVMLLCLWRSHKGQIDPDDVSYTDVTITKEGQPKRDRELSDTTTTTISEPSTSRHGTTSTASEEREIPDHRKKEERDDNQDALLAYLVESDERAEAREERMMTHQEQSTTTLLGLVERMVSAIQGVSTRIKDKIKQLQ